MPGFVKKIVKTEYIPCKLNINGQTFGQILDQQIAEALEVHDGTSVQEFQLMFEESEWREMQHGDSPYGDRKRATPKRQI
jgi:hypothetical protein